MNDTIYILFRIFGKWFFWYFLFINTTYVVLLVFAFFKIIKRKQEVAVEDFTGIIKSESLPKITFILPVYNESKNIKLSIEGLIHLTYRYKEIIVVNDGSDDGTLEVCLQELEMIKIPSYYQDRLPSAKVRALYRSKKHPEVILIDKEHLGKYDALNAGVNACQTLYFASMDADTCLDNPAFEAFIRPILADPKTIAIAAAVRLRNGCRMQYNQIFSPTSPLKVVPVLQSLEYLRAFLERQGWDFLGGNFVLSGAFSLFQTEILIQAGGYVATVAEDMEIIIRLHRLMKEHKIPYKITYFPDPVAWTEGPSTMKSLGKQRSKWQKGLCDCLIYHRKTFFHCKYGIFGYFVYPFWLFCEALEPFVEAIGFAYVIIAYCFGLIHIDFVYLFIAITIGFNIIFTVICVLIEEVSFKKFSSLGVLCYHLLYSFLENIGYRQMTVLWRIRGTWHFLKEYKRARKTSQYVDSLIHNFRQK